MVRGLLSTPAAVTSRTDTTAATQIFIGEADSRRRRRVLVALSLLCALQIAGIGWTFASDVLASATAIATVWIVALQAVAVIATLVLVARIALYARYRPLPGPADAELPSLSVIIPAYNEGAPVLATVRSVMASDYPRARLQIIAIDDGSRDDTWSWIQRARAEYPDHVLALRCPVNRGKREALYEGFNRATNEVIVTIDSDSTVLPEALRNLVAPLVAEPRCGAVGGNVRVLDPRAGAIAGMLDVAFTSSFEFVRATQSAVGVVMCCPGALSAYRRALVDEFKDVWVTQTFLGQPAAIGEDRAMTNFVLRRGYEVHFQANAIVATEVPRTTRQLARMLLRWARSDVRETLALARILAAAPRRWHWAAHVNLVSAVLGIVLSPLMLAWLGVAAFLSPAMLGWTAVGVVLSAATPAATFALLRGGRGAWWAFPYAAYFLTCLSWIQPYALITPHRSQWLTRTLPAAPPAPATVPRVSA